MANQWTAERIRALPLRLRAELYRNACGKGDTPEGAALKTLIEQAGLPYSEDKCLTNDDPITVKMHQLINSKEGQLSAITATKAGLPAMRGLTPCCKLRSATKTAANANCLRIALQKPANSGFERQAKLNFAAQSATAGPRCFNEKGGTNRSRPSLFHKCDDALD